MDDNGQTGGSSRRVWLKRIGLGLGVLLLLLIVFHRPILQTVVRRVAIHYAAKENLKLDLRVGGSVLGAIELRNVRAVATGPSALQSADVDLVRADYSLFALLRGGMADFLKDVEVRNGTIVLDPAKAPPEIDVPEKDKKFTVPAFFPDRLVLSNVNVRIIGEPQDMVVENLNLELFPNRPGELRIGRLQLANGRTWKDVAGTTSYENRNLFLRDLVLDDQTRLDVVNIDASAVAEGALKARVEGTVAGAKISTSIGLGQQEQGTGAEIDFVAEDVSLDALTRYIDPPDIEGTDIDGPEIEANTKGPAMRGDVRRVAIKGSGQLERPSSWNGSINAQVENLAAGGAVFDSASIDVAAAEGVATINSIELRSGKNTLSVRGTAELPETLDGFGREPANIELRGVAPDLAEMTAGFAQPITGSAEINGRIKIKDAVANADLNVTGTNIDAGQASVDRAVLNIRAEKEMPPPEEERPYFAGLTSQIGLDITGVRAAGFAVDSIAGEIRSSGETVTVEQLIANRGDNRLTLSGRYSLPADPALAASQPGAAKFSLDAPNVGDFWASDSPHRVTGALQLSGQTEFANKQVGNGSFSLYGTDLRAQNLRVQEISASGSTFANSVYLNDLTARLNERDYVSANGQVELAAPYRYSGRAAVNVEDLSTFEPILRATGNESELAGKLVMDWSGSGVAERFDHTGDLKLRLDDGRYGDLRELEARIDANYTPEALNVPIVFLSSDKLMLQAVMQTRGEQLEISKLEIMQDKAKYAGGYISIPFVWENIGTDRPVLPMDGEVVVGLQSENLDIGKLAQDLGQEVPVKGLANIKIDASGTLQNLKATADLQLTGLRSEQLEDFTPATFGLQARIENNQLVLDGRLQQARIEPVQIDVRMPFNVHRIVEEKGIPDETPVNGTVRMPRSSMNFVRQFVPALRTVDGDVALNVDIGGTISNPTLSGSGDININVARFSNPTLPALSAFSARLVFAGDTLTLQQFRGELAGGPFTVSGRVGFPKLTEPTLDLTLRADAVLVARNDNLTARADANLRVVGPFDSASVTGSVALTNSRFLKNIDLIPIGLPGRPAPRPQPPQTQEALSFPEPPLRDWKFDVAITTKDPFLIRGNLANGAAIVDMRLVGTGLNPGLTGMVRLQNVEATLPFSRLAIDQGFLYFEPTDPLNPRLELQGTSLIRDYTIRVFIYGTANNPEAVFTSQPPLPQEEIISLLATGTTREELLGGGNVLAGRAAMLLIQQLYQKVFKKGDTTGDTNSFFDRLQLDVGNVDPRTGQQSATARFRINQQFVLIGTVGVEGDFRGMVKYLLRFR